MDNIQRSKTDTCNRVAAFNTHHAAKLATIPEYAHEQAEFDTAFAIIKAAAQVQAGTPSTTTDAVNMAKETMANTVVKYALRATVKAKQLGNTTLAASLNHPATYISNASKTLAVNRAKDILKHLDDSKALLTNITAANLTEITVSIAAYDAIKDNPTIDQQHKTANGTNPLAAAFNTVFEAINNMYDLALSYFVDTDKTLVDDFALAKQIIVTGTHHNGVAGTVTTNGHGTPNVTIALQGTTKIATTDADGHYTITKLKTGTYTIVATATSGTPITKNITITKGHIETVDFNL